MRLKASHASRRSASGPNPIPIGQIVVDGVAHNRQSQGREVTLLKNGMIVEHVDVRKEEKERRREEKRKRDCERGRVRRSSRGSGDGQWFLNTSASNGSGVLCNERPMSLSQASIRTMSAPLPLTPGSFGFGPVHPPNARMHLQVSLVDSQSISSASFSANRRSLFFAFKNWSEAWKSRESFAPSCGHVLVWEHDGYASRPRETEHANETYYS
ncbi:hypothetical protein M0805_004478 [Coniferiporia weirii]|nr:hypothetical protein M0805_004478 [Coniferiporia weirii]